MILFNKQTPSAVTFNGKEVKRIIFNGDAVWDADETAKEIDKTKAVYFGQLKTSNTDYFDELKLIEVEGTTTLTESETLNNTDTNYVVLVPTTLGDEYSVVASSNKHLSTGQHKLSDTCVTIEKMYEIYSGLKELTEQYIKENKKKVIVLTH